MRRRHVVVGIGVGAIAAASAWPQAAQLPLSTPKANGQTVTPVFEGWYPNPDGSVSLSFGYFNRNADETLEVPLGAHNFLSPGAQNQGQPTSFEPRRHWGVFAAKIPAGSAIKEIVWTLEHRGVRVAVPGTLHPNWQIDALEGEAGSGNTPPIVKIGDAGAEARGPGGSTVGPLRASVGQPLALTIWAQDDGRSPTAARAGGRGAAPAVSLAYFKHQGPGAVVFTPATGRAAASGATAGTSAVFSAPGDYVLRVRANDASGVANAGHAQCCWTNAFVKVSVTR